MLHFKIKTCGVEGCKESARYECSCNDSSNHLEDTEGWATPPPKEKQHARYVCEQHMMESEAETEKINLQRSEKSLYVIDEPKEEKKMKVERKITITLSKEDLFAYIKHQEGMDIKDAVVDVEIEGSDNVIGDITWTELKGDIRVEVQSYAGADEPEMNSDVEVQE